MIGTYELYFDRVISFGVAFGILMSSQLIGFGWAGLLQPVMIYPSRTWDLNPRTRRVLKLKLRSTSSQDEIFPTYITPAFQAINIFCLTLPKNQLITTIFGGARPFEGMGLFSISADWSMVGGRGPLYLPLSTQIHQLVALVVSTLAFFLVYSKSWFGAGLTQNFPFMSASLLTADGKTYPYRQAVNADGTANEEFIQRTGLPFFTATFYVSQILATKSTNSEEIDPHRLVCLKYKNFPLWGFATITLVAIGLTFGISSLNNSGISFVGLLVALIASFLMTLAVGFINAMTGFTIRFAGGIQMLGGILFPGNVFGNMWFTIYGASSALQGINILKDAKYGQYIHLPQNLVVYSQLIGCTIGSLSTLLVVKPILRNQREVLLSPNGNGVFSGAEFAAFQARSVRLVI
ncbi:hypothetical protein PGTUg99_019222 [Puccinia graminis f. sp. tritici]|uniref:Uncharacterized protein n=1 Tax=Puccinia graminis f. sp. tritici TaxID=56615 RepID=A0A5B0NDU8_PUCGR|nr:hypothetical protein PGTUg99_019222 [Puccinia graminis f. sp. tritici]